MATIIFQVLAFAIVIGIFVYECSTDDSDINKLF